MRRLESWKDIAAYLGRQVRTVQRWEITEALPVHRHHHRSRGSVYAFAEELDGWLESRRCAAARATTAAGPAWPAADPPAVPWASPRRSWRRLLLAAGAVVVIASGLWLGAGQRSPPAGAASAVDAERAAADLTLGEYLLNRNRLDQQEAAIAAFERAVKAAPANWRTHAGLAQGLVWIAHEEIGPPGELFPRARDEARVALALAPGAAEPLAAEAWVEFEYDWRLDDAETTFRAALSRQPDLPFALHGLAYLLSNRGRHDEALAFMRRAQRSQILSEALNTDGCWLYYHARRYAEAEREAGRALTLEPGSRSVQYCTLLVHRAEGDLGAARQVAIELAGNFKDPIAAQLKALPPPLALERWNRYLIERLDRMRQRRYVAPGEYAMFYAALGEREQALTWLARSSTARDRVMLLLDDPGFDAMRGDPRFAALEQRVGLETTAPGRPQRAAAIGPRNRAAR
jgi:tetratricopeptide (TPR) repeat protein